MRLLLNLIWLVFGGLVMALGYAFAGLLLAITVVGIPFAIASLRTARFALWPFGRRLVDDPGSGGWSTVGNLLWLVLAGWWLALGHITAGIASCLTIIGIPLGIAHFKLVPVSLLPMGRRIVDTDDAYALLRR
ncbi:YccF domain-containing protein [Saccharopolyspora sp. HNM0983]|uniref:YccF domain-containing protein n=1 Tax=Saccharopolyspora montiporae TaxID=2781240 RepID=A0A929G0W0_9PSEU|nr:YccF domain-containing protein [Saccharopolyspora sp. HNM0983]MBE9374033.1 YccF domain-containing protein [Saccharopolyspora sp. HNM0983]